MRAEVIAPEIKIRIFQPNTDDPIEEIKGKPIAEYVTGVSSTRGLKGHSMKIELAQSADANSPYRYAFQDGAIVQLLVRKRRNRKYESFRQLNICQVTGTSVSSHFSRKSETVTLSGFDHRLRNNRLFLDVTEKEEMEISLNGTDIDPVQIGNTAYQKTITAFANSVRQVKSIQKLFFDVYDNLIADLANPQKKFLFGGKKLFQKSTDRDKEAYIIDPFAMETGYTENFIHIFNFLTGYKIGDNVNFWDIITSLECEPLYELFFDPLEEEKGEILYLDTKVRGNDVFYEYAVPYSKAALVFRKTPFDWIFKDSGEWNSEMNGCRMLQSDMIKSISLSENSEDAYSGIHVGMSFLGNTASTLINHPFWNLDLISHFGYKPMQVKLDGLTIEKSTKLADIKNSFQGLLKGMQERLYNIFCKYPKVKTGNVDLETQFDFFRPGTPLHFGNPESDYGDYGYIESVTDTISPKGNASTSISLKWVDYELKTYGADRASFTTGK